MREGVIALRYTHDGIEAEILAHPVPNTATRVLSALLWGVLLFPTGFCSSFFIGAIIAGLLEQSGFAEEIPLSAGLLLLFTALGLLASVTTFALQLWRLRRQQRTCRYHLSVDTQQARVTHDGREQRYPLAGLRVRIEGTHLVLSPRSAPDVWIPMHLHTEQERAQICEAISVTPPPPELSAPAPPAELLSLSRRAPAQREG